MPVRDSPVDRTAASRSYLRLELSAYATGFLRDILSLELSYCPRLLCYALTSASVRTC